MIPRPEHPNPQFERKNWINLNGEWEFSIDYGRSGRNRKWQEKEHFDGTIIVPFCPESKLSGVQNTDFMAAVWYRRNISIPRGYDQGHVMLHFGAVDYHAFVYVNGKLAGTHRGGYSSFSLDITDFVHEGENQLTVCAEDDTRNPMQPVGKQCEEYYSMGCSYTRTTGIWQTVWLEFLPASYIRSARCLPDEENCAVTLIADCQGQGDLTAEVSYQGEPMGAYALHCSGGQVTMTIPLAQKHLWELGNGRLYDLALSFGEDRVKSYFGLRSVRLEGERFLLNGKSVFQRLILDQGFYREGIYTAPTEEHLIQDIRLSMAAGFNGARLHQKVFEPRFLYHCDRMGYMVWGEFASWGVDFSDPRLVHTFLPEWCEVLERDWNHPAIIGWCPFNETWWWQNRTQCDSTIRMTYEATKRLDPWRPCIDSSGGFHVVTDIFDVHNYDQDPQNFRTCYQALSDGTLYDRFPKYQKYTGGPVLVSEYGGIHWDVDGSQGWGYGEGPKTEEEFLCRYQGLTDALLDNPHIMGFCYTQLTDVEQEVNGLYTYDRVPKFDTALLCRINSRKAEIEKE